MSHADKDIERLIVRRLDGALTADEELELDREIIRNPEARTLYEEYSRIDELAASALDAVLDEDVVPFDPAELAMPRKPRRTMRHRHGWLLVPGAIAAALLALVIPRPDLSQVDQPTVATGNHQLQPQMAPNQAWTGGTADLRQPVSIPSTRRITGREVFGVVGDDGNIYWIEVDRTRTIKRPRPRAAPWTWDEM